MEKLTHDDLNSLFFTDSQALTARAYAQLTHIIAKINEDYPSIDNFTYFPVVSSQLRIVYTYRTDGERPNNLKLESKKGFDKLLSTNTPLLNQYFQISD